MTYKVNELLDGYAKRIFNSRDILEIYIKQIRMNDIYKAFIEITSDLAYKNLKDISFRDDYPLYGIPIAFKDVINIEGYITSNGTYKFIQKRAERSAKIVDIFIKNGGIILGKNNLFEFSSGVTSNNNIYGDVINPRNNKITAGGSSSGSAVAVASGLVPCAIGTDTSGSVRIPAACCEIIGLKLAYQPDLLEGITPLSKSLDHLGIFTQDVKDMETIFNVLNNTCQNRRKHKKKLKIGIPNSYFNENFDKEIELMMSDVYSIFETANYELIAIDTNFLMNYDVVGISRNIGTPEFTVAHYNHFIENEELYSSGVKESFNRAKDISSIEYLTSLRMKEKIKNELDNIFKYVDVILTPTLPMVTPEVDTHDLNKQGTKIDVSDALVKYTTVFNLSGHPSISIPSGYKSNGISQSFQMVVHPNNESLLFEAGKMYENIRDM